MIRCERKDLSLSSPLDASALVFTQISFQVALDGLADFHDEYSRQLSRLTLTQAYLIFR